MAKITVQENERTLMQQHAREVCKYRLMKDIRFDIEVCKLEGWDYTDYLLELKEIIDGFLNTAMESKKDNQEALIDLYKKITPKSNLDDNGNGVYM